MNSALISTAALAGDQSPDRRLRNCSKWFQFTTWIPGHRAEAAVLIRKGDHSNCTSTGKLRLDCEITAHTRGKAGECALANGNIWHAAGPPTQTVHRRHEMRYTCLFFLICSGVALIFTRNTKEVYVDSALMYSTVLNQLSAHGYGYRRPLV